MKKIFITVLSTLFVSVGVYAQLFKADDVAKIADYVVSELQLTGSTAQSVKSIYADYGEKMRLVSISAEGLNAKQSKIQGLTSEMDNKVIAILPKAKVADYNTVTTHYRKVGIGTSALNNSPASSAKTQEIQTNMDQAKDISENLKNEFKSQLGVNDTQADQLVKITLEHNLQKKIINQTFKTDATTRSLKMKQLNDNTNSKVKNILNEQQYKKFLMILIKNQ